MFTCPARDRVLLTDYMIINYVTVGFIMLIHVGQAVTINPEYT